MPFPFVNYTHYCTSVCIYVLLDAILETGGAVLSFVSLLDRLKLISQYLSVRRLLL